MSALHIINPTDRKLGLYANKRFVLWFGHSPIYLMVYGRGLEEALEEAAGWLADNTPGLIMPMHDDEHMQLIAEVAGEHGLTLAQLEEIDEQQRYDLEDEAVADCTYTESGYINSDEWGIALDEHASRAEVKAFIAELAERHYSDEPVVTHG